MMDFQKPQAIDRCGWYLRVSTPKQKLEHQREHVLRFCQESSIHIPDDFRFEDTEKRHRSDKRKDFQRLLATVEAGKLDWILICSFDRWGVADVDEFFEFRRLLLKHDVQLWSVVDHMNLTGISEGDYFRIVAMAIGATRYVDQMAEKNILKMIEMAKQGWATTGNAPFGTDLVCYPLNDICKPLFRVVRLHYIRPHQFRILWYSPDSRVERNDEGHVIGQRLIVVKDETTERMPARDKKATGYRYERTIEDARIKAINLAFEMYESGMGWAAISKALWQAGFHHYGKPFQDHALESILANPACIGLPTWGKIGTGAYRVTLNEKPIKVKRKSTDTVYLRKNEEQWIQPVKPVFLPLVPADLWERVKARLADRGHTNPDFGQRRTRDKATHPLNGKLVCPDCNQPMVLGSYCPAVGTGKKKTRCFNCGTYRKFGRLKCYANTIGWDKLDKSVAALLEIVKDRIAAVTSGNISEALQQEEWLRKSELGTILVDIFNSVVQPNEDGFKPKLVKVHVKDPDVLAGFWEKAFGLYNANFDKQATALQDELRGIEAELDRIAVAIAGGIPSQSVRDRLNHRMAELEARKGELTPKLVPLTATAGLVLQQLQAIRRTIDTASKADLARLLDSFIERVIPRFEVKIGKDKKRRAFVRGFQFVPRQTTAARNILPQAMEICATHTDRGSSPRRGRSGREKSSN